MTVPKDYIKSRYIKNKDIEDIYGQQSNIDPKERRLIIEFLSKENLTKIENFNKVNTLLRKYLKKYKINSVSKTKILNIYHSLNLDKNSGFYNILIKKPQRGISGVMVVTVLTSPYPEKNGVPQKFSCEWDCHYCPKEPDQPRSYLHDEPSVIRANKNDFDARLQLLDRCHTLKNNGHNLDKIELLVLGGTWHSYPKDYREKFVRDLYYAANTFGDTKPRLPLSLEKEKLLNTNGKLKIIGLTLETRPDCITIDNLKEIRKLGCTRVQIGVQHTNNRILKKINRKCTIEDVKLAIYLLKKCGIKVDIHLMPQLPGATPDNDRDMFNKIINDSSLQADQIKVYPCEITPWTKIKKWYEEGKYKPYADDKLVEVLIEFKSKIHPYIRLNRIIRDIPSQYIEGGVNIPHLRQLLKTKMDKVGLTCDCIRCRQPVKNENIGKIFYKKRVYHSSDGLEYFLSFESKDEKTIYGFLRLRLDRDAGLNIFPELSGCAMIRELHIYGHVTKSGDKNTKGYQHIGLGNKLINYAHCVAISNGYLKLSVIPGEGVRNYYKKNGFMNVNGDGYFMIRKFNLLNLIQYHYSEIFNNYISYYKLVVLLLVAIFIFLSISL